MYVDWSNFIAYLIGISFFINVKIGISDKEFDLIPSNFQASRIATITNGMESTVSIFHSIRKQMGKNHSEFKFDYDMRLKIK